MRTLAREPDGLRGSDNTHETYLSDPTPAGPADPHPPGVIRRAPRVAALLPERSELPLLVGAPRAFAKKYRFPLAWLLLASVADAVTTYNNLRAPTGRRSRCTRAPRGL